MVSRVHNPEFDDLKMVLPPTENKEYLMSSFEKCQKLAFCSEIRRVVVEY